MSIDGSVCFFVLYHYELNAILVKAIANVDDHSIYEAYKEVFETLEAKGYKPKMNVMDNQATKFIKKFLTKKGMRTAAGGTTQSPCQCCRAGNPNIQRCIYSGPGDN